MTFEEVGMLFDIIADCYPSFSGDLNKMKTWHDVLAETPYESAVKSLKLYASKTENRFSPHPGALAMTAGAETEMYHTFLRSAGQSAIEESGQIQATGVPPTEEQRRKVRDLLVNRLR